MASTLLAVDDSVTMRKVLEITFGGTDLKVITANTSDAALQQLKAAKPDLVISDITLEGKNGYELCKAIKQQAPGTQVLLLSSKQNPYDAAKGSEAKADDHMDKPFDTQQMIDKVKKMLSAGPSAGAGAAAPAPVAQVAAPATAIPLSRTVPGQGTQPSAAPQAPVVPAATASASGTATRAKTLLYNPANPNTGIPPMGVPVAPQAAAPKAQQAAPAKAEAAGAQAATPATGVPYTRSLTAQSPVAVMPAPAPSSPGSAAAVHVNGHMASKLEGLGLTPVQVDAVLALSREVVERVVWEVVPVLAETLIKEEIARITK